MLETDLERYFKNTLEGRGFKVLKLTTPGTVGSLDRMILRPRYWPGPPMFVEFKKPGAPPPRPNQVRAAADWKARGAAVLPYIDTKMRADIVIATLIEQSQSAYAAALLKADVMLLQ